MISLVAPSRPADRVHASPLGQSKSKCEASSEALQCEMQQRARVLRHSREDCEARVLQYSERMLAVARRMLRCEEDAADAVQDALMSAFASIHQFRASSQLYTWLHRIVVNACLMKLRSRKRMQLLLGLSPAAERRPKQRAASTSESRRAAKPRSTRPADDDTRDDDASSDEPMPDVRQQLLEQMAEQGRTIAQKRTEMLADGMDPEDVDDILNWLRAGLPAGHPEAHPPTPVPVAQPPPG